MPVVLPRKVPLTELHCHLGGAVAPAIMWGIAHSQGIRLPTKDYWEFREMITVSPRRGRSLRRLPPALPLDRADPVVAAGGRALGLRGGRRRLPQEQRDHHRAALQPHEAQPRRRAGPGPHHQRRDPRHGPRAARVPGHAGPDPLPGPSLPVPPQRDHRGEGHRVPPARRGRHRHRRAGIGRLQAGRLPAPVRALPAPRARDNGPHGRGGRRSRRSARSSSSWSRRASATASRPPTTRGPWA